MSEVKNAGWKGYLLLGGFLALLLFIILVVWIYNSNWDRVPEDVQHYGSVIIDTARALRA